MKITIKMLKSWEACEPAQSWFAEKYPKGATITQLRKADIKEDWLRWVVCYAPDAYRAKASEVLLSGKPSEDALRDIVCYAPDAYRAKASEVLLSGKPSEDALRDIVCYAPDAYRAKARAELKRRGL
jgi:hypothetical protein